MKCNTAPIFNQPQDPNYPKILGLIEVQNSLNKLVECSVQPKKLYTEKNALIQKAKAIFGTIDFVGLESDSDILNNAVKLNKSIIETGAGIDALLKFRLLGYNILKKTNVVGLFRSCGSKTKIEELLKDFDNGINPKTIKEIQDVHMLTGAFKQLVEKQFSGFDEDFELVANVDKLKAVVQKLKIIDRKLLNVVFRCLSKVAENSAINSMNAMSLATCITPRFIESDNPFEVITKTKEVIPVIQCMIENYDEIFR